MPTIALNSFVFTTTYVLNDDTTVYADTTSIASPADTLVSVGIGITGVIIWVDDLYVSQNVQPINPLFDLTSRSADDNNEIHIDGIAISQNMWSLANIDGTNNKIWFDNIWEYNAPINTIFAWVTVRGGDFSYYGANSAGGPTIPINSPTGFSMAHLNPGSSHELHFGTGTKHVTTNSFISVSSPDQIFDIQNAGDLSSINGNALNFVTASGNTVTVLNAASGILSAGANAIYIDASAGGGAALDFTNEGTVTGHVVTLGADLFLTNTGTITGNIAADASQDFVIHRGTLAGDISLAGESDVYRGTGSVTGTLDAGDGDDRLFVKGAMGALSGGAGFDLLVTNQTLGTVADFERVILRGDAATPLDIAVAGADGTFVFGSLGDNVITGSEGDDHLRGNGGNDRLDGMAGRDILHGGAGADVFVFSDIAHLTTEAATSDVIRGYQQGTDQIDLSGLALGMTFLGSDAFTAAGAGEVRFSVVNWYSLVEVDTDGNGTTDAAIVVAGSPTLDAADFLL